eukprot:1308268-Lingulodinium_polyedra.AAC.1
MMYSKAVLEPVCSSFVFEYDNLLVGQAMAALASFRSNTCLAELVSTATSVLSAGSIVLRAHVRGHSSHPWNDLADAAAGGQVVGAIDIEWPECLTEMTCQDLHTSQ